MENDGYETLMPEPTSSVMPTAPAAARPGEEEDEEEGATVLASVFNLANTTLGAGIVAIPFFFSQCGVVLGAALLVSVGVMSALASLLLVAAADQCGSWSYIGVAKAAYGERGERAVQAAILLLTIGVMSAFYVQLGETGSEALQSLAHSDDGKEWFVAPLFVKATVTALPLLPLCLQRNLASLAGASMFVVAAIGYLVVIVIALGGGGSNCGGGGADNDDDCDDDALALDDGTDDSTAVSAVRIGPSFFSAVPIAVLAFGNQVNVHQVISELRAPTPIRRRRVILYTDALVTAVYATIGIAGYAHFGNGRTKDNILSNYADGQGSSAEEGAITAARVGIVVVVLCSYPMLLFPCRNCLHYILSQHGGGGGGGGGGSGGGESIVIACLPGRQLEVSADSAFVAETVGIMGVTFVIAWAVPTLSVIMGFTGAVMGTFLGFIFPAMYYLKLLPRRGSDARGGDSNSGGGLLHNDGLGDGSGTAATVEDAAPREKGEKQHHHQMGKREGALVPGGGAESMMRGAAAVLLVLGIASGVVCVSAQIYGMVAAGH